jgi:hypothetical protein
MSLSRRADPIRLIAMRLGQGELQKITSNPAINEAIRVSIHYHDGRGPNSVATLERGHGDHCQLHLAYDKSPRMASLKLNIPLVRYQNLLMALRRARFDTLDDEDDLPYLGVDLWLIERAAGSFYHDIVVCPTNAKGHHREIVLALRQYLPEAVRTGA